MRLTGWLGVGLVVLVMTGCGGGGGGSASSGSAPLTPSATTGSLQFGDGVAARVTHTDSSTLPFNVPATVGAQAILAPFDVQALDANGNRVAGVPVTLTLVNPQGAMLGGLTTETTRTDGSPAFQDVTISLPGQYSLMASATGFTSTTSNPIMVLNTSLSFGAPISSPAGTTSNGPIGLAVGDYNQSGVPSAVVSLGGLGYGVFSNDGSGHFSLLQTLNQPDATVGPMLTADLNQDGFPDVVTVSAGASLIILQNTTPAAGSPPQFTKFAEPNNVLAGGCVAVGDLNGDNVPDVVVGGSSTVVLFNQTSGHSFAFSSPVLLNTNIVDPQSVAIADMNGDHHNDIVLANASEVAILTSDGGSPPNFTETDFPLSAPDIDVPVGQLTIADLNGDGLQDIILSSGNGVIDILLQQPAGSSPRFLPILLNGFAGFGSSGTSSLLVTDVNGDGTPDILDASAENNQVFVAENLTAKGSATLNIADPVGYLTSAISPAGPIAVAAANATGGAKSDLVVANTQSAEIVVLPQQ